MIKTRENICNAQKKKNNNNTFEETRFRIGQSFTY